MSASAESVWLRLKAAGLVSGELPPTGPTGSPWFVYVMLVVTAWIGALFLFLFVGFFLITIARGSPGTFLGLGFAACVSAAVLLRRAPEEAEFAVQHGLAVSLAGQGLVLFALSDMFEGRTSLVALIIACLQVVLFVAVPNFVHRVWSAGSCAAAGAVAMGHWHVYATGLISAGCAWIWLHEFQYVKHGKVLRSCGYGLVLALIGTTAWVSTAGMTSRAGLDPLRDWGGHRLIATGLSGAVLLWAVRGMLAREAVDQSSRGGVCILAAAGILALTTLKAPGLAPAVLILLIGYGNGNLALLGLGVAALLGYLSFYYYSLETTLLYKSVLMATTGLGLLVARVILQRVLLAQPARGEGHA